MTGSGAYDPRITPARADLAAAHLEGKVQADRFVAGEPRRVIAGIAPLHNTPQAKVALASQVLYGEIFVVYETTEDGWCWGQCEIDDYVGWVPAGALGEPGAPPTHRVSALRTHIYPGPEVRRPPRLAVPFGGCVVVARRDGDFAVTDSEGYIFSDHLAPIDYPEPEFIRTARRFFGVPYLWGGRTGLGIDCSGLVQVALQAAGIACPRDSDMQARIGAPVQFDRYLGGIERGDFVCWKGHIGMVAEPGRLIHANAHHMQVAEEPLKDVVRRLAETGLEILDVRRIKSIYAQ
jgi:cell wall-associated NlpC family hydrolase